MAKEEIVHKRGSEPCHEQGRAAEAACPGPGPGVCVARILVWDLGPKIAMSTWDTLCYTMLTA